jgi:hypothetical protein
MGGITACRVAVMFAPAAGTLQRIIFCALESEKMFVLPLASPILDARTTPARRPGRHSLLEARPSLLNVEHREDIRPALERAQRKVDDGMVALVNVKTDYRVRATAVRCSNYMTLADIRR